MSVLDDQIAIVTGGASGIGRAISRTFANAGADVVIADIREEPREGGQSTHAQIEAETAQRARYVECDVTNRADLETAVETARRLGGLDIMVNNAGIFRDEEFFDVTEAAFDELMDINVKGVFFGAQVAAAEMTENGGGCIVNLSSIAGIRGGDDYITYCTSKGAVQIMTYALADKLGPDGIRVNALHPGIIETTMTTDDVPLIQSDSGKRQPDEIPARRFGHPIDVAEAAVFLASPQADYITGESLLIDGGLTNTN